MLLAGTEREEKEAETSVFLLMKTMIKWSYVSMLVILSAFEDSDRSGNICLIEDAI